MHGSRLDRAPGGDERLGGDLSAEDPLDRTVRALAAKQVHFDCLEVEEVEECCRTRAHAPKLHSLLVMPAPELSTADASVPASRFGRLLASAHFAKLWRYMAVSVITTLLTLVLLYVFWRGLNVGGKNGVYFLGLLHISSAELANVLATGISTIPSYTLNRKWAWGKSGKSHVWREVVPFWVIAVVSLVLSTWVVGFASREAVHLSSRREVQTILGEIGNLATYGVMWIAKYVLFNKVLFQGGERTGRAPLHLRGASATRRGAHSAVTSIAAEQAPAGTSTRSGRAASSGGDRIDRSFGSAVDAG